MLQQIVMHISMIINTSAAKIENMHKNLMYLFIGVTHLHIQAQKLYFKADLNKLSSSEWFVFDEWTGRHLWSSLSTFKTTAKVAIPGSQRVLFTFARFAGNVVNTGPFSQFVIKYRHQRTLHDLHSTASAYSESDITITTSNNWLSIFGH